MKKYFILILLFGFAFGQNLYKREFLLNSTATEDEGVLLGNGIVDLLLQDSLLWAGTGYGLNKSGNGGQSWSGFRTKHYLAKGGIAAIAQMDSQTIWISTAFDTNAADQTMTAGGGLSYTRDGGENWHFIKQPVDSRDEKDYSPTTVSVSNITYDIAAQDSTIWITSWAGGLRKSDDMGKNWTVKTIDGEPFRAANDNVIHLAFSVLVEHDNLWVGTAGGIGKSTDRGESFEIFTHSNQEQSISGNFVVALGYQEYNNTLWAATIQANDQDEVRAISKTSNGGATWQVFLEGVFAHNFAFDGPRVYVASDEGLFLSEDDGQNWYQIPGVKDATSGQELLTNVYYSVAVQKRAGHSRLWVGSADGLAYTDDNGNNWHVIRSYTKISERPDPKVYAYPSPFSPSRHGYTRFEYGEDKTAAVDIKIYDFAMDHVRTIPTDGYQLKWDGLTETGRLVASGVYYFRAELDGQVTWGKIVVIN